MNKLINWIFYQIKLRQEIADQRYRKEFESLVAQVQKSVKTEIKKKCDHKELKQVNGVYYQCQNKDCNVLVNLTDAQIYDTEKFIESHEELINDLKCDNEFRDLENEIKKDRQ